MSFLKRRRVSGFFLDIFKVESFNWNTLYIILYSSMSGQDQNLCKRYCRNFTLPTLKTNRFHIRVERATRYPLKYVPYEEVIWGSYKYLLLGDVNRLIEYHPCDRFVASWHGGGSVVRHVIVGLREQPSH